MYTFIVTYSLPNSDKVFEETVEAPICEIYSAKNVIYKKYPDAKILTVRW